MTRPVFLTRDCKDNEAILSLLDKKDDVFSIPVFDFAPSKNEDEKKETLSSLGEASTLLMVSPRALGYVAPYLRDISQKVSFAAPGVATAKVIKEQFPNNPIYYPDGAVTDSGSEALIPILEKAGVQNLIICRAQTGRELLADTLESQGVHVTRLCVYEKTCHVLSQEEVEQVTSCVPGPAPLVYITSVDAVAPFFKAYEKIEGAVAWLRKGIFLTIHPRIAQALNALDIKNCRLTSAAATAVAKEINFLH